MTAIRGLRGISIVVASVVALSAGTALAERAVIEHIEPTSGPAGTVVSVIGRGLGAANAARLGATQLKLVEVTPSRMRVALPEGVQTGELVVETPTGLVRGPEFRVTPPLPLPVIDSFEPRSGSPGSHVLIRGRHFSPRLTGNAVTLAGQPVVVYAARPEELDVIIPDVTQGGPFRLRVQNAGEAVSGDSFEVAAKTTITAVKPLRAAPGMEIVIAGTGFSPRAADNRVFLNNVALEVVRASAKELVVRLAERIASGTLLVDVQGAGRATSPEPFVVQWPPTIVGFAPTAGEVGSIVTVRGTNFGDDPAAVEARMGEATLAVREVHRTRLVVEVPDGATSAKLSIRVHGVGPAWSEIPFYVVQSLQISRFAPQSGPVGTIVTIEGQGFPTAAGRTKVTIGGRVAEVIEASDTKLEVRVPAGPSGPIEIEGAGGRTARTRDAFIITEPPKIDSATPQQGVIGTDLTIRGRGFGTNPRLVQVTLGGHALEVRSVRDDLLIARLTRGARSGALRVSVALQGSDDLSSAIDVLEELIVSAIEPWRAPVGNSVTVRGVGFAAQGTLVEFGGVATAPDVVEAARMRVTVPIGARTGIVMVRLADGRSAPSPRPFTVTDG